MNVRMMDAKKGHMSLKGLALQGHTVHTCSPLIPINLDLCPY